MIYGIFTKPIHVEKIVNYLNKHTNIDYVISTERLETRAYNFDIGISYCFPYIVDVNYPIKDKRHWFNYHPGILPQYPGLSNYADAIRDGVKKYGVTLHRMTKKVDCGEIIKIKEFRLDSVPVNANELGCITHYYLFQLFKETIRDIEKICLG